MAIKHFSTLTFTEKQIKNFWSKIHINTEDNCWNWISPSVFRTGYGRLQIRINKIQYSLLPHRLAYFLTYNIDPKDLFVCHHCDNRKCCNPNHLFLGTHQDNMDDMTKKGRYAINIIPVEKRKYGHEHDRAKYTKEQIIEIQEYKKQTGYGTGEIGHRFGICKRQVRRLLDRKLS